MYYNKKNSITTILVVTLVLGILIPTLDAMGFKPLTEYQSADYAISMGDNLWDGSDEGYFWNVTKEGTILSVSITSSSEKTVRASLHRVIKYWPDNEVISVTLTGSNGEWKSSPEFIPAHPDASHYPKVKSDETLGVEGRISVQ